jgi:hypothetical protein
MRDSGIPNIAPALSSERMSMQATSAAKRVEDSIGIEKRLSSETLEYSEFGCCL